MAPPSNYEKNVKINQKIYPFAEGADKAPVLGC